MTSKAERHYRRIAEAYWRDRRGTVLPTAGAARCQWSDAWLLQAIMAAQGDRTGAELYEVVGAGDAINHAIFTDAELDGGFARLLARGYIAVDGERVGVTPAFRDAWASIGGTKRRAWDKHQELLETLLDVAPRI